MAKHKEYVLFDNLTSDVSTLEREFARVIIDELCKFPLLNHMFYQHDEKRRVEIIDALEETVVDFFGEELFDKKRKELDRKQKRWKKMLK